VIKLNETLPAGTEKCHQVCPRPQVTIEKQRLASSGARSEATVNFDVEYTFDVDPVWEFDRDQLVLGHILGEGAFGRVVQATANGIGGNPGPTIVAIKMLRDGHTDSDVVDLVSIVDNISFKPHHVVLLTKDLCHTISTRGK